MKVGENKLWFLRGVLVATCSNRQTITYDEVRRLCRLNDEQLGTYLGEARQLLREDEPDYCAVVVKTKGVPGESWGDPKEGPGQAIKAHQYWQDRRHHDNQDFTEIYGSLPSVPGLANS